VAVYCITGNLGSGKSLVCIGRLREHYLRRGRKVATNFDLRLEHLTLGKGPTSVLRVPDYPSVRDLLELGTGQDFPQGWMPGDHVDEGQNGMILLDEISGILDARQWQGKERFELIEWLKHTRKVGWDLYLVVQHESMLDAQVRKFLLEHLVVCKRLDRIPVPFIGFWLKSFGLSGKFLKAHLGTVRYGASAQAIVSERWWFRGHKFYAAYNTRQLFRHQRSPHLNDDKGQPLKGADGRPLPDDNPQGTYQYLDLYRAPWLKPDPGRRGRLIEFLLARKWKWAQQLAHVLLRGYAPGQWFDFWLAERHGPPRYLPAQGRTFAEWDSARRVTAPEGGPAELPLARQGGEGATARPRVPQLVHSAASELHGQSHEVLQAA
jgi:hypothetical protein